jgi:hypothetical protein
MTSPLGSFLLTLLSTESQYGVGSGEASIQVLISEDNAKIIRLTSCASFSSSNDSDPDVLLAAINVTREGETKLEKTMITRQIVQEVKAAGDRFLKSDEAGYVVVDDSVAREKVSSSFRDRRKKAANAAEGTRKRLGK